MVRKTGIVIMAAALLALLSACGAADGQSIRSATLVIINGTVIDGTGADPIPDGLVAVRDNRIIAVGRASDFTVPRKAQVIDAEGGAILPGIINTHVHGTSGVGTRRISFLLDGVTTVCDAGGPLGFMAGFEAEEVQPGSPAARGFKSGPIVAAPGGYPGPWLGSVMIYPVEGEDEAANAVRDLHERGADYIKLAPQSILEDETLPLLTPAELRTVVDTAHELGITVRAHVTQSDLLGMALDAGVDTVEHVPMPTESPEELARMIDEAGVFHPPPELETQLLRMVEQGVVLVPTFEVYAGRFQNPTTGVYMQSLFGVVRFFYEAGGIVALGNDYGNPGVGSGMPLDELAMLQNAGLPPMAVIESATRHAAVACGQGDELGTLENGMLADIIVVTGDPLEDLQALDDVLFIIKDGELVTVSGQDGE